MIINIVLITIIIIQAIIIYKLKFKPYPISHKHKQNKGGLIHVYAPFNGVVFKILVKKDSKVLDGDTIVIMEAMKMETEIKSPINGIVTDIQVKEGDDVYSGEILISIKK